MSDSTISLTPNLYAGLYSITAPPYEDEPFVRFTVVFSAFLTDGRGISVSRLSLPRYFDMQTGWCAYPEALSRPRSNATIFTV